MVKFLLVALVAGYGGFYWGSNAMQSAIAERFAGGEGAALCSELQRGG